MTAAKAFIGALVAGLAPIAQALQAGTFDAATVVIAVSAGLVAFSAIYFVPNKTG